MYEKSCNLNNFSSLIKRGLICSIVKTCLVSLCLICDQILENA